MKWIAIAQKNNIKNEKIFPISFENKNAIIWKTKSWKINVTSHICTHLWACLSKGKVMWEKIECPFHGYQFDKNGESVQKIPKIRKFNFIEKFWIIWIQDWKDDIYDLDEFIKNIFPHKMEDFFNIDCYTQEYDLPIKFLNSNFFDLWHFKKVHWVEILEYKLLHETDFMHYVFRWRYQPKYFFQKIFFKFFPNYTENEIIYKKNFLFSRHSIVSKKWKKFFEYFWIFPVTKLSEEKTLVISNILVKKWFFWFLAKLFWAKTLFKATNEEFEMLKNTATSVKNFTNDDVLLKKFYEFYDKE